MKKIIFLATSLFLMTGCEIKTNFTSTADSALYLTHYREEPALLYKGKIYSSSRGADRFEIVTATPGVADKKLIMRLSSSDTNNSPEIYALKFSPTKNKITFTILYPIFLAKFPDLEEGESFIANSSYVYDIPSSTLQVVPLSHDLYATPDSFSPSENAILFDITECLDCRDNFSVSNTVYSLQNTASQDIGDVSKFEWIEPNKFRYKPLILLKPKSCTDDFGFCPKPESQVPWKYGSY